MFTNPTGPVRWVLTKWTFVGPAHRSRNRKSSAPQQPLTPRPGHKPPRTPNTLLSQIGFASLWILHPGDHGACTLPCRGLLSLNSKYMRFIDDGTWNNYLFIFIAEWYCEQQATIYLFILSLMEFCIVFKFLAYDECCCFGILIYASSKQMHKSLLSVEQGVDTFGYRAYTCLPRADIASFHSVGTRLYSSATYMSSECSTTSLTLAVVLKTHSAGWVWCFTGI